jgi:hypothetical protein
MQATGDPNRASYYKQLDDSQKSFKSAVKKFEQFLPRYVPPPNLQGSPQTPQQYFGTTNLQFDDIADSNILLITVNVMDQFALWLATEATTSDEDRALAFNTCDRYLSALKTSCQQHKTIVPKKGLTHNGHPTTVIVQVLNGTTSPSFSQCEL